MGAFIALKWSWVKSPTGILELLPDSKRDVGLVSDAHLAVSSRDHEWGKHPTIGTCNGLAAGLRWTLGRESAPRLSGFWLCRGSDGNGGAILPGEKGHVLEAIPALYFVSGTLYSGKRGRTGVYSHSI